MDSIYVIWINYCNIYGNWIDYRYNSLFKFLGKFVGRSPNIFQNLLIFRLDLFAFLGLFSNCLCVNIQSQVLGLRLIPCKRH